MPSNSVAFDRAAEYYDRTRGFPEGVEKEVAALMAQTGGLTSESRVLEIGVGTGRIALPLSPHVGVYVGIDLARPMMDKLHAKQSGESVYLAQADAAHLPFASGGFDAVIAVHVFHLIPAWREVLVEVARVLRPGGVLIHGWNDRQIESSLQKIWDQAVNDTRVAAEGAIPYEERQTFLENSGWRKVGAEQKHPFVIHRAPRDFFESVRERLWSSLWRMSDEQIQKGLEALEAYVTENNIDVNQTEAIESGFKIQAYLPPDNT